MNKLNNKISIPERMKNCYVPFDACFGLSSSVSTTLFLPPSKMSLGIISKLLPTEYPLEFMPCEYFCISFENDETRFYDGFKLFKKWIFGSNGNAELYIESNEIDLTFKFEICENNCITINTLVRNKCSKKIRSMIINPCLRYQNHKVYKGMSHENIYINTNKGVQSVSNIMNTKKSVSRILILHKNVYNLGLTKDRTYMLESLMKSRFMNLSDYVNVIEESIICMNMENNEGIIFGYSSPFAFFSRSNNSESGCIHVIPLFESIEPQKTKCSKAVILWDKKSANELQEKYSRIKQKIIN